MQKRKIIKIDEEKCNGCGQCVPNCPEGALQIINGKARLVNEVFCDGLGACIGRCPQGAITIEERDFLSRNLGPRNWPVQITLVPISAPYFKDADLLIAADCVAFSYAGFHSELLPGKILLVGCPKLDDAESYAEKLTRIFQSNEIKSVTCAHMEVPCCFGLVSIIKSAIAASGKNIEYKDVTIRINGEKK